MHLAQGTVDLDHVIATVQSDKRLRTKAERCAVIAEVLRSSPLPPPETAIAACKGTATKTASR